VTEVLAVKHWRENPGFDEQERGIFAFCEKLTLEPWSLIAADLESLRAVGFSERQVLDIVLVGGYRHFIARIADGTGIELKSGIHPDIVKAYSYEVTAGEGALTGGLAGSTTGNPSELTNSPDSPWIKTVPDAEVETDIRTVYLDWQDKFGFVPNLLRALSLHPKALCAAGAFWQGIMFGASGLGRRKENLIALIVADINYSPYFQAWHRELLRREWGSRKAVERLQKNWRDAGLDRAEEQMLTFAEKLTLDEGRVNQSDIEALRGVGFTDPLILDMIVEVAYLNCFTRIANALGILVEPAISQSS
jgi:uncharacterized peroxidase-related enzyme